MAFPVDILITEDHGSLEMAAKDYMSQLLYRNPDTPEYLSLPDSKQIPIGLCNVSFVPLYGADAKEKALALFSPDEPLVVVGLYLLGQWWTVEDILKTSDPSRTGLVKVRTIGERIVLYVLNRVVYRARERSSEDVLFLCHCEQETAKILWKDGEAIGFYSVKPKGSLCRNFLTQCYQLPVMDTVFVRKCHRRNGHGLKMLEDFVGIYKKENVGLKFPLSKAMYKVCENYFSMYPADKELLWEVLDTGGPFQRTLIARKLQKLKLNAEKDHVVSKLDFEVDDRTTPMETESTEVQETTEYTMEIVEETVKITKEVDDIPVSRHHTGSNLKRRGIREDSEEMFSENIIRVEDIEAGVETPVEFEEKRDNSAFSEAVLKSTTVRVTAAVTNIPEDLKKEEKQEIEKELFLETVEDILDRSSTDLATAMSEDGGGNEDATLVTDEKIKRNVGSEEKWQMDYEEYTVNIHGATLGSIDQSQLQSVVDVEIVKMSTGTEEELKENLENGKEVEEDESTCETEREELKMLDESEDRKDNANEKDREITEESVEIVTDIERIVEEEGAHADETENENTDKVDNILEELTAEDTVLEGAAVKNTEDMDTTDEEEYLKKTESHWDVEIENEQAVEDEVTQASPNLIWETENISDNDNKMGSKKYVSRDEDSVLRLSIEDKEPVASKEVVKKTDEVPCGEPKQSEADVENEKAFEPSKTTEEEDTVLEQTRENKIEPELETDTILSKCKAAQKRRSAFTPSRSSKRLKHQSADIVITEGDLRRTTKSMETTTQQRSKQHREPMMQEEDTDQAIGEPEDLDSEVMGKIHEPLVENTSDAKVEGYKENDKHTVEAEVTNVEETSVFDPEVSKVAEDSEIENKETSSKDIVVESADVQEAEIASEEDVEKEENGTIMLTMRKAKVVLVDVNKPSSKEADEIDAIHKKEDSDKQFVSDNYEVVVNAEQDGMEQKVSHFKTTEQQTCEEMMRIEESEGTQDNKCKTETACTKGTEEYDAEDGNTIPNQLTTDKEQEEGTIKETSSIEGSETEPDTPEVFLPSQTEKGKQAQKQISVYTPRRSRRLKDQLAVQTTSLRVSTCKAVIHWEETAVVEPQAENREIMEVRIDENLESDKAIEEYAVLEKPETANVEDTAADDPEGSELLKGASSVETLIDEVSHVKTELDEDVEESTLNIKLPKATVMLVDLNRHTEKTEGTNETTNDLKEVEELELDEQVSSEHELCHKESEEKEQQEVVEIEEGTKKIHEEEKMEEESTDEVQNEPDKQITFMEQKTEEERMLENDAKRNEDLEEGQNVVKETVDEYTAVIDEAVEEAKTSGEHLIGKTVVESAKNENSQNEDIEMTSVVQEKIVQVLVEEQAPVSTLRNLRRRTVRVQSPPRTKSKRIQKMEADADFEKLESHKAVRKDKAETVPITEKGVEETVQEIKNMENKNKEANLPETKNTDEEKEVASEMGGEEANIEQTTLDENEKETAEREKPTEMNETPMECEEQIYVVEDATIPEEGKVSEEESTETNQTKDKKTLRKSLRLSARTVISSPRRKSEHILQRVMEPVNEADISENEYENTLGTTEGAETVSVPIITVQETKNLDKDGDIVSEVVSSDEKLLDISVMEKLDENEILAVEIDKTEEVNMEENIQDNKDEKTRKSSVEKGSTKYDEEVSQEENLVETNQNNEYKTTAVQDTVLESSGDETLIITRKSLRRRTVTVKSTPRRKSKRHHRQEEESENDGKDSRSGNENDSATDETADILNILTVKDSQALNSEESIAEFESMETKKGNSIIYANTDEKENKKDEEEGEEVLTESMDHNSANQKEAQGEALEGNEEITDQDKTHEEHLEGEDVHMPKAQIEAVFRVQEEEKQLPDDKNEGIISVTEGTQESSSESDETSVVKRELRKRAVTVTASVSRKSKRLRKQEHDGDSQQVKEQFMRQTEYTKTVDETAEGVELRSDGETVAVFKEKVEDSNLVKEIPQQTQEDPEWKKDTGEFVEGQKSENKGNKNLIDEEDVEDVMEQVNRTFEDRGKMVEEVREQNEEQAEKNLSSNPSEGFILQLEEEERYKLEDNKVNELTMDALKEMLKSKENYEEAISDEDEDDLAIEKHIPQRSSSPTASTTQRVVRLSQLHETEKSNKETELDSEEKTVEHIVEKRHQRKKKVMVDFTPTRRSKRYGRANIAQMKSGLFY